MKHYVILSLKSMLYRIKQLFVVPYNETTTTNIEYTLDNMPEPDLDYFYSHSKCNRSRDKKNKNNNSEIDDFIFYSSFIYDDNDD